jgi:hypothetical protein
MREKCETVDVHTPMFTPAVPPDSPGLPPLRGRSGHHVRGGWSPVFPLANPQPAKLQHRFEIGSFGLALRVEIARISTRKV